MDNQRLFLYGSFLFVLFLIWQTWEKEHAPQMPAANQAATVQTTDAPDADLPMLSAPNEQAEPTSAQTSEPVMSGNGSIVTIRTDVLELEINTRGADIQQSRLLEYPLKAGKDDTGEVVTLLETENGKAFISQSGIRAGRNMAAPDHTANYTAEATEYVLAQDAEQLTASFYWEQDGIRVEKRYTLKRGSYQVFLDYLVSNNSSTEWRGDNYLQLKKAQHEVERDFFNPQTYSYNGLVFYDSDEYRKLDLEDISATSLRETVTGGWAAMIQHYFLAAVIPPQDAMNAFYAVKVGEDTYRIGYVQPSKTVPAGGQESFSNRLFIGPKLQDRLADVAPKLELAVDYGVLTIISEPLFFIMEFFHSLVGNWGWAIILLVILIKAIFYKLSEASGKSMAKMKRIQPRMQALKERYGDDREALNRAMMEMYKKEKINPAAGCLPILVQLPVFIALYWVLLESVELRQAPWFGWIQDLSTADPYYILPVLMVVASWAQQKMNPQPTDPIQARVMMAMPVMMGFFAAIMPSGLVLYWVLNSVLTAAQQWQINRIIDRHGLRDRD